MSITGTGTKEAVGQRIREKRQKLKMTGHQLAELLSVPDSRISEIENGKRPIHVEDLPRYADALQTSVEYIVTGFTTENKDAAERTGLSNESINMLWACSKPFGKGFYPTVPKVIDILLQEKNLQFLRLLYSYIIDDFSLLHYKHERMIKYDAATGQKVTDDFDGEVKEIPEIVPKKLPTEKIAGLSRDLLEKAAAIKMVDYVQDLRADYQKKQAETGADSE